MPERDPPPSAPEQEEVTPQRPPRPAPFDPQLDDTSGLTTGFTLQSNIRVRPGREDDFTDYMGGYLSAAAHVPGYSGSSIVRPARGDNRYRLVVSFDSLENAVAWRDSEERALWIERGEDLMEAPPWISNITGTAQASPLALARTPLNEFIQSNISGIGLLLLGTVLALAAANTPLFSWYDNLWNTYFTVGTADHNITVTLRHWINDGLMALFFFILGLEIKRELLVGELRTPRAAALPIAAAIGGAVGPSLVFLAIVLGFGGEGAHGWGIPIGTDTAFAIGLMSLFGGRVRAPLMVFLTAFAIIDDIIAVLVIAVFYTADLSITALMMAVVILGVLIVANRAGIQSWPLYAVLGVALWLAVFQSGVHGTIAGILLAMVVPARAWINPSEFLARGRRALSDFEKASYSTLNMLSNGPQQQASEELRELSQHVQAPLTRFEHRLHPFVALGVVPLFAFANAGIPLVEGVQDAVRSPVAFGVMIGLLVGKPIGITLFTWLAVRSRMAVLHQDINWSHVLGVACMGGIGFTMSLFISELSFGGEALADVSRIGILFGSLTAGFLGFFVLRRTLPRDPGIGPSDPIDHEEVAKRAVP